MRSSGPLKIEEDELPEGTVLDGRFRVRSMLGEGGLGCVYLAEDLERGHDVALKILIPRYRGRPEREQRLINEAKFARQMGEHSNWPHLYGSGRLRDLGGCPYVAWEVVQGLDLNALLTLRYTIVPRIAVRWSRQLADALCAMHRAGVVHRDVTVTNVFIEDPDGDSRVKLIDLSHSAFVCRSGESSRRITREWEVPGAHRFMAPEQAMGAPAHPKMDVFSFGVVLYEMLTGRNPFRHVLNREAYVELYGAGKLQVSRIDRRVYPNVPEALVELVEACTDNEAEQRPEMAGVARRLREMEPKIGPVLVASNEPSIREVDEAAEANAAPGESVAVVGDDGSQRTIIIVAAVVVILTVAAIVFIGSWGEDGAQMLTTTTVVPSDLADSQAPLKSEPTVEGGGKPELGEPEPEPEVMTSSAEDPEPERPVVRKRKPSRPPKTPPHETEACRLAVSETATANRGLQWERVEALTRKKKCFEQRGEWAKARARSLYETGRLAECIAFGDRIEHPSARRYAGLCRAQQERR